VRASGLRLNPQQTAHLIWEARDATKVDVTAADAREGPLRLREVRLRKRGAQLSASALATKADVSAALPAGVGVQLLRSEGGSVEVRASGALFGVGATIDAVAGASEGKLLVRPRGFLLQAFALTLFSDPHVYLQGLSAGEVSAMDGEPAYRFSMRARLR
jgi:hypothetical protein